MHLVSRLAAKLALFGEKPAVWFDFLFSTVDVRPSQELFAQWGQAAREVAVHLAHRHAVRCGRLRCDEVGDRLGEVLNFIPDRVTKQKRYNNTMLCRMQSEGMPPVQLRLKIEINCYEHFTEMGFVKMPFSMENQWFSGSCAITTYTFAELLGTKLRALYQRKKGRDLLDLYLALTRTDVDTDDVIRCYKRYMGFVVQQPPTYKQFVLNMEEKMQDRDFLTDSKLLLRPEILFDPYEAYDIVKTILIDKLQK